ncbi:MAG: hypothetical protein ACUVXA_05260 [Candidatus Jordarchaeum sp.]|uniref:hypothetical protein n=1 Tax=Candidatus Jordarchaeum sp. TaxID=2823881 RepID=UPI00404B2AF5
MKWKNEFQNQELIVERIFSSMSALFELTVKVVEATGKKEDCKILLRRPKNVFEISD